MPSNPRMPLWLDLLHTVHPPCGVLLVGAGDGTSPWVERLVQWDVRHVTLVEGEEMQFRTLHDRMAAHAGWTVRQHVVAAEAAEVTYHRANLAIESGLLEPESLRPLWPHLATRLACTRRATTLHALMQDSDSRPNWLIVDCLPALALLQGAGEHLQGIDVIAARVLLGTDPLAAGPAGQTALRAWLEERGFLALDTESGRHPAIGHAVFVRDTQARLQTLSERLADATRQQQQHIEQLQQTVADAAAAHRAHADEVARLTQAQQAADKLAADRHRTIVQLRQAAVQAAAQAEAAAATQAQVHADEIARLTQAQQRTEQLQTSAVQRQQELATQVEKQRQARAAAEKLVAELRVQAQHVASRANGDADIDDLLQDISVYFTERSITYVDVGAYVGDVFLKLAGSRQIKVREAHLYEPNPTSYQALTSKLESCRLPTLHAYHLAVGARPEILHFNAAQSMTRVVEPEQGSPQISNTFTAHSVSLDEQARLFTDQKINLLKIDVEGRELDVLMGATALLQAQRIDMLYIEVGFNGQGTQQTYFADIDRFLQDKGYRVFRLYEQMNEWTEDSPFLRRCNVAYMSEHFARANPSKLTRRLQTLQEELHRLKSAQTPPLTPALP